MLSPIFPFNLNAVTVNIAVASMNILSLPNLTDASFSYGFLLLLRSELEAIRMSLWKRK